MRERTLILPFPPSVNGYWRAPTKGPLAGRHLISKRGREYRQEAIAAIVDMVLEEPFTGRLIVDVELQSPDARARDLDNYLKSLLDAITHAGVWQDDGQIDDLRIRRGPMCKGGKVVVQILEEQSAPQQPEIELQLESPF